MGEAEVVSAAVVARGPDLAPASCQRCGLPVLAVVRPMAGCHAVHAFDPPTRVGAVLFMPVHACDWDRWDDEDEDEDLVDFDQGEVP